MNWKDYEDRVFEELRVRYPNYQIKRDAKIYGVISQTPRQIDVLIEAEVLDSPVRIIVDAKMRTQPIDVNDIESFIAMMADVKAHRGMLVSTKGYTKAAILRAHNERNQDIELDVLSLEELKCLQGTHSISFSGSFGVLLSAPFGWVIDAKKREGMVAMLYQRGFDLDGAGRAKEFMYLNFWAKETPDQDIDCLLKYQASTLHDAKISYLSGVNRNDAKSIIRLAEVPNYPTPEYTGFVEFEGFIFFAVLFTTPEMSKRNLRKLREVLRTVSPVFIKNP
jgi:Restriction endonuclease